MIAAQIGLSIEQFENMTPREFSVYIKAYQRKLEIEQEQRQQGIYISAILVSQFVWTKGKIPSYEQIFKAKTEENAMSDEAMLRKVEALNALFGGNDLRKKVP